ncbi:MAG: nuclear transport factor 2 family protein [Leptospiraceae bacterium]|nr:nuclear transport factor 2 family protein [Leptospiraceae bacterium]
MDIENNYQIQILWACLAAWNKANADDVISFYAEDVDYRDPNLINGIKGRKQLHTYLKILFHKWPVQKWTPNIIHPHLKTGNFSIDYAFYFGNKYKSIQGRGIDLIVLNNDKIQLNHVYLNADAWAEWIKR